MRPPPRARPAALLPGLWAWPGAELDAPRVPELAGSGGLAAGGRPLARARRPRRASAHARPRCVVQRPRRRTAPSRPQRPTRPAAARRSLRRVRPAIGHGRGQRSAADDRGADDRNGRDLRRQQVPPTPLAPPSGRPQPAAAPKPPHAPARRARPAASRRPPQRQRWHERREVGRALAQRRSKSRQPAQARRSPRICLARSVAVAVGQRAADDVTVHRAALLQRLQRAARLVDALLAAAALIPSALRSRSNYKPPSSRISSAPRCCSVSSPRSRGEIAQALARFDDRSRPQIADVRRRVEVGDQRRERSSEIDSLCAIRYSHGFSVILRVSPGSARQRLEHRVLQRVGGVVAVADDRMAVAMQRLVMALEDPAKAGWLPFARQRAKRSSDMRLSAAARRARGPGLGMGGDRSMQGLSATRGRRQSQETSMFIDAAATKMSRRSRRLNDARSDGSHGRRTAAERMQRLVGRRAGSPRGGEHRGGRRGTRRRHRAP